MSVVMITTWSMWVAPVAAFVVGIGPALALLWVSSVAMLAAGLWMMHQGRLMEACLGMAVAPVVMMTCPGPLNTDGTWLPTYGINVAILMPAAILLVDVAGEMKSFVQHLWPSQVDADNDQEEEDKDDSDWTEESSEGSDWTEDSDNATDWSEGSEGGPVDIFGDAS